MNFRKLFNILYDRNLFLFLIILPAILGLIYIKLFGVNVVFMDQWALVPLIEKLYTGTLSLSDLFAQHNEHRLFFPRIVMLILAYLTHFNTIAEMYFSWILAVITLALIFKMYLSDFGNSTYALIKFVPIAWIMFSFRQFENILWGWQIQIYLSVLGFVASIYMLEKSEKINYNFLIAIFCGIVSTFSFMNGLIVWPVGLTFIIFSKTKNNRVLTIVWALIGLIVWSLFFYNWTKPSYTPFLSFAEKNPFIGLTYIITNIGAPLAFEQTYAFLFGIVLVISIAIAILILIMIKNKLVNKNAKWLSFILFSIMTSLALTIGRSGFGVEQALSSRYVTFTSLGIVGLYLIVMNLYNKFTKNIKSPKSVILFWMIVSIIFVGIIAGYIEGMKIGKNELVSRELMASNLIDYKWTDNESLKQMFPSADLVKAYAKILDRYKLNVFHSISASNGSNQLYDWNQLKRVQGGIMWIDTINERQYIEESFANIDTEKEQFVRLRGWAVDDKAKDGTVKSYLIFENGNDEITIPTAKTIRPDVAEHFGVESYIQSGWSGTIFTKDFKSQCYNISVRIKRTNVKEYYELLGEKPICFV
ncbi:MAG: hypothetical protein KKA10_14760 [Euryarchaeota archaeon]|nr:hypothetical protein [Euryarchaeota archaeon]MCG2737834.1 hypothetical protein [Candidatus Methanoperedenaceae archaeon]